MEGGRERREGRGDGRRGEGVNNGALCWQGTVVYAGGNFPSVRQCTDATSVYSSNTCINDPVREESFVFVLLCLLFHCYCVCCCLMLLLHRFC